MLSYNPDDTRHRRFLAGRILNKLKECGFTEDTSAKGERTFFREIPNTNKKVVVYTTIVKDSVREVGKDAIRICGVYVNSEDKVLGLVKNKRVNRTGDIDGIVERMYQRMRETYGRIMNVDRCGCGVPKFLSKNGNFVCSEFCWTKR